MASVSPPGQGRDSSRRKWDTEHGDLGRRRPPTPVTLSNLDFSGRLGHPESRRNDKLIYSRRDLGEPNCIVNIATLQRLNILGLQKELVDIVGVIDRTQDLTQETRSDLRKVMSEYVSALRDWETMKSLSQYKEPPNDPGCITTFNFQHRMLLEDAGILNRRRYAPFGPLGPARDEDRPGLPMGKRHELIRTQRTRAIWRRFVMALLGAAALLGPMILMVLHKDVVTTLVTTSVAVLLVAVALSVYSSGYGGGESPATVMAIVAAYAAVLVVFVGSTSPTTPTG